MSKKPAAKITRRDRSLIRRPGGLIASNAEIAAIKQLRAKSPKTPYKKLSAAFYASKGVTTAPERLKRSDGTFIGKAEAAEIKRAARELNIPIKQALAIHNETNRLERVEIGSTMLHSQLANIDAMKERNKNLVVKIKLPGEKRYRVYKNTQRAKAVINKLNSDIFKKLRKGLPKGKPIPSDALPIIKAQEAYRIGQRAAVGVYLDYNTITSLDEMDSDEWDELQDLMG